MDCRTFRVKHLGFVDDTLPGIELVAMQRHLLECEVCARHDSRVRRGVMLVRSLPCVEPSPGFSDRLQARLQVERAAMRHPPAAAVGHPTLRTFVAGAAGVAAVVAVAYLAAAGVERVPAPLTLPPVVATRPEPLPPAVVSPVVTASVSTGISLWPVMLFAEQAPIHFVTAAFQK